MMFQQFVKKVGSMTLARRVSMAVAILLMLSTLVLTVFGSTLYQFAEPYRGVKPVAGERPLLVFLLEPDDVLSRNFVDVYALKSDGHIGHTIFEIEGSGEYTGWHVPTTGNHADPLLETQFFKSAPVILDSPDGSIRSVFALGEDSYIYQHWAQWSALPGTVKFNSAPAAMNSPDGKLASVFALGQDDYIYQIVYSRGPSGGWGKWTKILGSKRFKSAPAVMNSPDGTLASVFALGQDGYIYQIVYSRSPGGGWGKWTRIPGTQRFKSAPAAMNSPDGTLASVFALGQDDYIYQIVYVRGSRGGWREWSRIPGSQRFKSAPAVMNSPDGELASIFALGQDDYIYRIVYSRSPGDGWGKWTRIPGSERFKSAPAVQPQLLHKKSREYLRQMIFGTKNSVRDYFLENSYRKFTFKEAMVTPWLTAQDDPRTPDWDESSWEYMYTYPNLEEKSAWVIQQVEKKMTSFQFRNYDRNKDGVVTADELAILWVYPGGGDARARATDRDVVPVPSLSQGVQIGLLLRGGAGMSMATVAHELGHQALNLDDLYAVHLADMAIAGSNDRVYVWLGNEKVGSGTTWDLDYYIEPIPFSLPDGKAAGDIVGIGIAGSNDRAYAWYRDGTVSSGIGRDLDKYSAPSSYTLPPGKSPNDIVGMGIAGSNDHVYAWYRDGTMSSGTPRDLDQYREPYSYSLPSGKSPGDIVGMGIAGSNDYVYVWYRDGTVSSGTSWDLDQYSAPYVYSLPPEAYPGPGRLSLMDNQAGGSHLDPWSKMKLGWLKPKVVTQSGWYTLNDVERHPEAYILYDPDHGEQEYFIVENRWPGTSCEAEFNGQGLAIWHIDESYQTGDHWGRKTIHLVKAGGLGAHDDKALWDGSDPQTGYDLTPDSFPSNTRWRDGSSSGISIRSIPVTGPQVSVYFEVP